MAADIHSFGAEYQKLLSSETETTELNPLEPELRISIKRSDSLGHFLAVINVTPNHMTQDHRFEFEIDQTFVRELVAQC